MRFIEIEWEMDLYPNYSWIKLRNRCANKGHLLQGLVVFVPCVQFGSHPYPFRTVLRFNVRFDVVTLQNTTFETLFCTTLLVVGMDISIFFC